MGVGGFGVIMLVNKVINFQVNVTVTKNFIGRAVFSIFNRILLLDSLLPSGNSLPVIQETFRQNVSSSLFPHVRRMIS